MKKIKCIFCGKIKKAQRSSKRYCSKKCQKEDYRIKNVEKLAIYSHNRWIKQKEKNALLRKRFNKQCKVCGTEIIVGLHNTHQLFCSKKCCRIFHRATILEGKKNYRKKYPERVKEQIQKAHDKARFGGLRRQVMERDGFACVNCGKQYPIYRIAVHHRDGNKQNNTMKNLITLCCSCHAKKHS